MAARRRGQQRDQAKERRWRQVLRQWRRSGLNVREFCDWQNLPEASFYAWRREIAKRDREGEVARPESAANSRQPGGEKDAAVVRGPAFVPVRIIGDEPDPEPRSALCLEVRLPNGVQLRVPAGFDRQLVLDVLVALEQRPC